MSKTTSIGTIGLFGTCGNSTWRQQFLADYSENGIQNFNPQVTDWNEAFAKVEAENAASNEIILFPVTDETYGTASLAEIGLVAWKMVGTKRQLIVMVAPKVNQTLTDENPVAAKESNRSRTLVLAHLTDYTQPNVHVVNTFDEMLTLSKELHAQLQETVPAE